MSAERLPRSFVGPGVRVSKVLFFPFPPAQAQEAKEARRREEQAKARERAEKEREEARLRKERCAAEQRAQAPQFSRGTPQPATRLLRDHTLSRRIRSPARPFARRRVLPVQGGGGSKGRRGGRGCAAPGEARG